MVAAERGGGLGSAMEPKEQEGAPGVGLLLRSLLFDVYLYGSMGVLGLLFAPAAIVSRDAAYFAMRLYCAQALWMLKRLCGLEVEIRGAPPKGAMIVAAEHQSFLDILVLMRVLDRPKFVMKRSLIWAPVLGLYALRIGATPIDRSAGARAVRGMTRKIAAQRGEDGQIVIFPQGARAAYGAPVVLKRGVLALYRAEAVACAPLRVNTGRFWARRSLLRRPGRAVLAFGAPIPPGLDGAAFMAALEHALGARADGLADAARPL